MPEHSDAQMKILQMIEDGKISAEEGVHLLESLKDSEDRGRHRHRRKCQPPFEFDWAFDTTFWEKVGKKMEKEISRAEKRFRDKIEEYEKRFRDEKEEEEAEVKEEKENEEE